MLEAHRRYVCTNLHPHDTIVLDRVAGVAVVALVASLLILLLLLLQGLPSGEPPPSLP